MKESQPLFLTTENATFTRTTGDYIGMRLDPPIIIPSKARNCRVYIHSSEIWYSFINISATNNKFYITDNYADLTKYGITIDNGLYSIASLSDEINRLMVKDHVLADGLVELLADDATGRVVISLPTIGWAVNFPALTPYDLLGATLNQTVPAAAVTTVANYTEKLGAVAGFSDVSSILLRTSLNVSSYLNNTYNNVLARIQINTTPYNQIQYQPNNLLKVPADNLIGSTITDLSVYITDGGGGGLDTNNENWSCTLVVEWDI